MDRGAWWAIWGLKAKHNWARTHTHLFIIDPSPLQNYSNIFQNRPTCLKISQGSCLGAKPPDETKTPFYEQWIFTARNNCHYPVGMLTRLDCIIYDFINASSYFKCLWVTFINKSINHVCNWEILLGYLLIASQFPRSQKFRKPKSFGTLNYFSKVWESY